MAAAAAPPLALTMGEPAGVGGELTLAAWRRLREARIRFFAIDDADRLASLAAALNWSVPVRRIGDPGEASAVFAEALPVLHQPLAREPRPGHPDPANAPAVMAAIGTAVTLARAGTAGAVVTNPIHKKALYDAGFSFPGHTEFLAALAGSGTEPVMMLAGPSLRVVPVTIHVSLRRALETLSRDEIVRVARVAAKALRDDFGIDRPRLAVAGVNPHAGEDGALGDEDQRIVAPAIAALVEAGVDATGPVPPDALFTPQARRRYDAAVCMYHDQGLIPLKALDFDRGVNVTLGLPFVRTSPDHGTAFDIAGTGVAAPDSLIAALTLAADIAARRAANAR